MDQKILLVIIYILNFVLLLPFIFVLIKAKVLRYQFNRSIAYVKHVLGVIIGINGPIRVGKTSLQSGLSSICQLITINDLSELIHTTKMIFTKIDFNEFNYIIDECLKDINSKIISAKDELDLIENITSVLIDYFKLNAESFHFNMLGQNKIRKLIFDYVEAYYCLNVRNNFVQSKTPFYSHITGNNSLYLDTDWLKIREAYNKKSYSIKDYMTILIDELTDEASAMSYLNDIKDEAGGKEYRRKFGQIHQERNRVITTKQDVLDEAKKFRNLTHSNLILDDKVKVIGSYNLIKKILEFFILGNIKMIRIFNIYPRLILSKIKRKGLSLSDIEEDYRNRVNHYRKYENKLYWISQFFKSISYNRYVGYQIKRAEDIEKVTADRDEFVLYIPTLYCFGTYDTHLYKTMQKELIKNSEVSSFEVNSLKEESHFVKNEVDQKGVDEIDF